MGFLDQIIGQVVGQMAGGAMGGQPPDRRGPQHGGPEPQGGGGIGDILGQLGGAGGKYSPLVLALLALLASRNISTGAGGYGSVLRDMFDKFTGRGPGPGEDEIEPEPDRRPRGRSRMEEDEPLEPEPRRGSRGRAEGGDDFLNSVGSMLDGPGGRSPAPRGGGAAPSRRDDPEEGEGMGGGLDELLEQFSRNGRGGAMRSWIGPGENEAISPDDLGAALGPEAVDQLSRGTGLGREELLGQLSRALPDVVDRLTPEGRVPSRDEQARWI